MRPTLVDGTPLVYHAFTSVKTLDFTGFLGIEGYLGKGEVMSSILIAGFLIYMAFSLQAQSHQWLGFLVGKDC
jgi:hypothetical protein